MLSERRILENEIKLNKQTKHLTFDLKQKRTQIVNIDEEARTDTN